MNYVFREKISLLRPPPSPACLVFVVEPEEYLLDLYCKSLEEGEYEVKGFRGLDMALVPKNSRQPDVAVINTQLLEHPDFGIFRGRHLPGHTKIISVGSARDSRFIGGLMSLGVSSHLERRLSRPGDLVEIVRALVYH